MPILPAVPALIGAGVSIYGASQNKKAANATAQAEAAAQERALAAQLAALEKITSLAQPFITGGGEAFDVLLNTVLGPRAPEGAPPGSTPPAAGPAGVPAAPGVRIPPGTPATPTPDYAAYLAANPDVKANFDQQNSTPEGRAFLESIKDATPGGPEEDLAAVHYQQFGEKEGRALPQTTPPPTAPDLTNAPRPEGEPLTLSQRPTGPTAPNFANYFDQAKFMVSPDYEFRKKEGLDSVNAASAVRGKLRSGDAAKDLTRFSSNLASGEYGNWFQRQLQQAQLADSQYRFDATRGDTNFDTDEARRLALGQFNIDRSDRNFTTDRSYQAGQNSERLGNLFDLAKIGLSGVRAVSGAQQNYADSATGIFGSQAQSAADLAARRAQANGQIAGSIGGAAGSLFANWGGGVPRSSVAPVDAVNLGSVGGQYGTYRFGGI